VRLYLDSNAVIFAHEGPPVTQTAVIQRVVEACLSPDGLVITSRLTRMECRVKPLRENNQALLKHYDFLFEQSGLQIIDISASIIEQATLLRAQHGFRAPDAIHLATAIGHGVDIFLTGDRSLAKCPGLHIELI
jgi:predicted nucleic acid-binding protein